jgi:hypothetical protein
MLQSLQFGHGLGQLNQVDVSAAGLVEDLDASHQIIGKTGLDSAVSVFSGTSYGKSFLSCGHNVAFQSCITG